MPMNGFFVENFRFRGEDMWKFPKLGVQINGNGPRVDTNYTKRIDLNSLNFRVLRKVELKLPKPLKNGGNWRKWVMRARNGFADS